MANYKAPCHHNRPIQGVNVPQHRAVLIDQQEYHARLLLRFQNYSKTRFWNDAKNAEDDVKVLTFRVYYLTDIELTVTDSVFTLQYLES